MIRIFGIHKKEKKKIFKEKNGLKLLGNTALKKIRKKIFFEKTMKKTK